jgi:uncharacterized protein YjiS (DUF1127 family)
MQRTQGRHAKDPIALHMQQLYLAAITRVMIERNTVMASIETSARVAPLGAVSIFRFASLAVQAVGGFVAWNNARKTRNALYALSNRELDDIGLCRADIETIGR